MFQFRVQGLGLRLNIDYVLLASGPGIWELTMDDWRGPSHREGHKAKTDELKPRCMGATIREAVLFPQELPALWFCCGLPGFEVRDLPGFRPDLQGPSIILQ